MKKIITVFAIALLLLITVGKEEANATPQTKLDSNNNIGYAFGDNFSIRFGEQSNDTTGTGCDNTREGLIRYNTSFNTIEFCNGSGWHRLKSSPTSVEVDYSNCMDGVYTYNGGLIPFGAPSGYNMDMSCNQEGYVVVATDSQAIMNNNSSQHKNIFCCKLKLVHQ